MNNILEVLGLCKSYGSFALDDVTFAEQKKFVIGYREHGTGFEGLIETANVAKLPRGVLSEQATLDEIIIFMNKEAKIDE